MRERDLPDSRGGLLLLKLEGPLRQLEDAPPERDGARGDDDRLAASPSELRDILGQRIEPGALQFACLLIHEQRRADFHHEQLCPRQRPAHGRHAALSCSVLAASGARSRRMACMAFIISSGTPAPVAPDMTCGDLRILRLNSASLCCMSPPSTASALL